MKAYTNAHVCRLCVSYACLFAELCFEMLSHQGGSSARQQPHSKHIFIRKSIFKQTKQKPWTLTNNIHLAKCHFVPSRPLLEALLCDFSFSGAALTMASQKRPAGSFHMRSGKTPTDSARFGVLIKWRTIPYAT